MSKKLEEMPLFPLHAVVFPYATVQVHVFEERYREMIEQCMEFEAPFGICLIRHGSETGDSEPYMVGTAVRIVHVMRFDDGRMDVRVKGERRFRIRRLDESAPCLHGWVEPVIEIDLDDSPRTDALVMRAREGFRAWIEHIFARQDFNVSIEFPSDPTKLSFEIANYLPLGNTEKQRLLETTDTLERLGTLIPLIDQQILEASTQTVSKITTKDLSDWIFPN